TKTAAVSKPSAVSIAAVSTAASSPVAQTAPVQKSQVAVADASAPASVPATSPVAQESAPVSKPESTMDASAAVKPDAFKAEAPKVVVTTTPAPVTASAPPASTATTSTTPDLFITQAMQKKITLQFRDATVRSLFDIIGKTSGLNVIVDKDVPMDMKTTVYLNNTTIEGAIKKILMTTQLAYRALDDNTILIYQDVTPKQRDYQDLVVRSFLLSNADVKVVANSLKTLLKFRDIVIDEKLNMIVVRDTPEAVRQAEKLIAMYDVPEPEVMLDVEVAEVSRTLLEDLGVDWPAQVSLTPLPIQQSTTGVTTTDPTTGAITTSGGTTSQLTLNDLLHLSSHNIGVGVGSLSINAHRNDGDVKTLANPRIRVKNKEKAKILIGQRVPNVTATTTSTGVVGDSINYVDVGLKLEVEPQIYADGQVVIKLNMEVSTILDSITTKSGTVAYRLGTRTATTVLRLKDGENQTLAGLIEDDNTTSTSKVPGLGSIPLIGHLFSTKHDDKTNTEIVLSITPRLVRGINRPPKDAAEFDAGSANTIRGHRDGDDIVTPVPDFNTPQMPPPQMPLPPGIQPRTDGERPTNRSD
ncbi:MAG TPA: secretin N-terminal domain-containing protein, partial [Rhodocyclaceae bacterium]|nr:secretin N-terminal domain-containing protein [Rhodocyclaceae bacterium]